VTLQRDGIHHIIKYNLQLLYYININLKVQSNHLINQSIKMFTTIKPFNHPINHGRADSTLHGGNVTTDSNSSVKNTTKAAGDRFHKQYNSVQHAFKVFGDVCGHPRF
jgi:hypothetical protein